MRRRNPSRAALLAGVGVLVLSAATAGGLATVVTRDDAVAPEVAQTTAATAFLEDYVTSAGRSVRRDQGGDTVSEGQAYAMLVAAGIGDRERFDAVWAWTRANLQRPDGLLSWRWQDGSVVDKESASDADLDAARALVVAGARFDSPRLTADGVALGEALLDHETVTTEVGRVLVAGTWVSEPPYVVNPSYISPAATEVLAEASGDPRWAELDAGSRIVVEELVRTDRLPPDWAEVQADGTVRATPGPGGEPERYGYDAARLVLRHAESCAPEDRDVAARLNELLTRNEETSAVYDLAGSPQTEDTHPLAEAAVAASHAATGDNTAARRALADARQAQVDQPTYYGGAWAALGPLLLARSELGGCPPMVAE